MHIILAGLSSLTTMGALFCLFFWFKNTAGLSGFGIYSLISLIIIFVFGGLTAFLTGTNSPIVGLMERITIGGFLQWMLVIGIAVGKLI